MVAGPYGLVSKTPEQRRQNLEAFRSAALAVQAKGHVPVVGLFLALPIALDLTTPVWDQEVTTLQLKLVDELSRAAASRCDAVLRLAGESKGADDEVQIIRDHGGLFFHSIAEVPSADPGTT
jgi:hypothetical protein